MKIQITEKEESTTLHVGSTFYIAKYRSMVDKVVLTQNAFLGITNDLDQRHSIMNWNGMSLFRHIYHRRKLNPVSSSYSVKLQRPYC